jgi:hypothetical protein
MKKFIVFALLISISGCAFVFQNYNEGEYKNLAYGMSRDEVTQALGTTQKISKVILGEKTYEVWEYTGANPENMKIKGMGTSLFKIFFLDDKVVRWDKDKIYAQPAFEFHETLSPEQKAQSSKALQAEQKIE